MSVTQCSRVPGRPCVPAVSWFTTCQFFRGREEAKVLFPLPGAPTATSTIGFRFGSALFSNAVSVSGNGVSSARARFFEGVASGFVLGRVLLPSVLFPSSFPSTNASGLFFFLSVAGPFPGASLSFSSSGPMVFVKSTPVQSVWNRSGPGLLSVWHNPRPSPCTSTTLSPRASRCFLCAFASGKYGVGFAPTAVTTKLFSIKPVDASQHVTETDICALDTFRTSASRTTPTCFSDRPSTVGGASTAVGRRSAVPKDGTTRGIATGKVGTKSGIDGDGGRRFPGKV